MSNAGCSEASAFSAADNDAPFVTATAPEPVPPPAPQDGVPSPRRGPPTGLPGNAAERPPSALARAAAASSEPEQPEVWRRMSDHGTTLAKTPAQVGRGKAPTFQSVLSKREREQARHRDVCGPLASPVKAANATGDDAAYSREEVAEVLVNPLCPQSSSSDATSPSASKNSGSTDTTTDTTTTATRAIEKAAEADEALNGSSADALVESSGTDGVFSLFSIAAPRTAEEYFEQVAKLDHVRCGLGQELEGDAKDVYGPTWSFSKRMIATKVVGKVKCSAPNCNHTSPIQAVTGPQIYSLLFIYGVLGIYPIFTTVAYAGREGWGGIIPLWLLSGVTIVFVTLCAFTNPGIVPHRRLQNVTDRGDILIVRVPAPNAQAVLEKLQALPDTRATAAAAAGKKDGDASALYTAEALHQAVVDGDIPPSVFNHKRTTVYSMERYFETDTGRIVPYNPVLSESDLAVPTLEFPISFCRTCRIARGPRTHHCKICNNCVDGMDHHCRWTNCCIGRNNYPYFFMSLLSLHLMVAYSLAYNFFQNIFFINSHKSWALWRVVREFYGMPIIVYGTFFFLGLFFFPLFLGHIYMTMMGLTTNELLKKKWTESKYFGGVNPWSHKHWYQNVYSRLLKRWPAAADDPMRWMDSRYYYGVAVANAVEDQKVDWLIALPPEEQRKVEARAAAERDEEAKARPAQEKAIIAEAMQRRGFRVEES